MGGQKPLEELCMHKMIFGSGSPKQNEPPKSVVRYLTHGKRNYLTTNPATSVGANPQRIEAVTYADVLELKIDAVLECTLGTLDFELVMY